MTFGALSSGFHPSTARPPNCTITKRFPTGSTAIPFGRPSVSPFSATVTARSGPIRKIRSGPGCSTLPTSSNLMPVSVMYSAPVGATATSLRNTAPSLLRLTLSTRAPVFALNARTTSMSATHSVSPFSAMPFGAWRVTPVRPPSMNLRFSTAPSGRTRLMKPLLSFAVGLPLVFETK